MTTQTRQNIERENKGLVGKLLTLFGTRKKPVVVEEKKEPEVIVPPRELTLAEKMKEKLESHRTHWDQAIKWAANCSTQAPVWGYTCIEADEAYKKLCRDFPIFCAEGELEKRAKEDYLDHVVFQINSYFGLVSGRENVALLKEPAEVFEHLRKMAQAYPAKLGGDIKCVLDDLEQARNPVYLEKPYNGIEYLYGGNHVRLFHFKEKIEYYGLKEPYEFPDETVERLLAYVTRDRIPQMVSGVGFAILSKTQLSEKYQDRYKQALRKKLGVDKFEEWENKK